MTTDTVGSMSDIATSPTEHRSTARPDEGRLGVAALIVVGVNALLTILLAVIAGAQTAGAIQDGTPRDDPDLVAGALAAVLVFPGMIAVLVVVLAIVAIVRRSRRRAGVVALLVQLVLLPLLGAAAFVIALKTA